MGLRNFTKLISSAAAVACFSLGVLGQQPSDAALSYVHTNSPHSSKTHEVSVPFLAETKRGDRCTVWPSDLRVVDNGTLITRVDQIVEDRNVPLDIIILADRSGSVQRHDKREIALLVDFIRNEFDASRDSIEVWSFQEEAKLVERRQPSTTRSLELAIPQTFSQHTALFDAVAHVSNARFEQPTTHNRPIMILLSDGEDNASSASLAQAAELAALANIRIYPFFLGYSMHWEGKEVLAEFARRTGGKLLDSTKLKQLRHELGRISEELRHQYRALYQVPDLRGVTKHRIEFLTASSDLRIRAGAAYSTDIAEAGNTSERAKSLASPEAN